MSKRAEDYFSNCQKNPAFKALFSGTRDDLITDLMHNFLKHEVHAISDEMISYESWEQRIDINSEFDFPLTPLEKKAFEYGANYVKQLLKQ